MCQEKPPWASGPPTGVWKRRMTLGYLWELFVREGWLHFTLGVVLAATLYALARAAA